MAHVRPLTHVRSCCKGDGPTIVSGPASCLNSSALLQGQLTVESLLVRLSSLLSMAS